MFILGLLAAVLSYSTFLVSAVDIIPDFLEDLGTELSHIWPVLLVLGFVGGIIWRFAKHTVKTSLTQVMHDTVVTEIRPIQEKVKAIEEQFQNNGGSSLKDAVDKVNAKLDDNNQQVIDTRTEMLSINAKRDKKLTQIHEDLLVQNSRISALAANSNAAYYEIDENAKLTYVNDKYLELYGMTYQQAMGNNWRNYIDIEDLDRVDRSAQSALRNRSDWTCDFNIVRTDGTKIAVVARAFPIWEGEDFAGYAGAMTWDESFARRSMTMIKKEKA